MTIDVSLTEQADEIELHNATSAFDRFFDKLGIVLRTISQVLAPLGTHLKALSALGILGTASISFIILKTYSVAIGRPDLISKAIDKAFLGFLPWIVLTVLLFVLYAYCMLASTVGYAFAVSCLKGPSTERAHLALLLQIPALVGSLLFVFFVFKEPELNGWVVTGCVAGGTLLAMLSTLISKEMRHAIAGSTSSNEVSGKPKMKPKVIRLFALIYILILMTVLGVINPISIMLSSFLGEDTPENVNLLMTITMLAVLTLYLPALTFFISKQHVVRRSLRVVGIAFSVVFIVVLVCPGASSTIVYIAAGPVGVRDSGSDQYRLLKNFKKKDFDQAWGAVMGEPDEPVVKAFPLLALGDVLLLCPSSLARTKLHEWTHNRSRSCILTQSSEVTKLPYNSSTKTQPGNVFDITTAI